MKNAAEKSALETLFLPLRTDDFSSYFKNTQRRVVFLNARFSRGFKDFYQAYDDPRPDLKLIQPFKPYAQDWPPEQYTKLVNNTDNSEGGYEGYDLALVLATKSRIETEIALAQAGLALLGQAWLICAADNKEGASRLKQMFHALGFETVLELSKHKARVCWAQKSERFNAAQAENWAQRDRLTQAEHGFWSRAGIYGWDKIDIGSALLSAALPDGLSGYGADFGCGYGALAIAALRENRAITVLDYIDADARALEACGKNLETFDVRKNALWLDLTRRNQELKGRYDWIVMNPPFHEGKKTDSDIGRSFIQSAAEALKKNGRLYMVANRHLPYETILGEVFKSVHTLFDTQGFKGFCALK
ncbi:MAG: class I SAM-dependent methyltransferase [Alphaproteobacteria bacterium]